VNNAALRARAGLLRLIEGREHGRGRGGECDVAFPSKTVFWRPSAVRRSRRVSTGRLLRLAPGCSERRPLRGRRSREAKVRTGFVRPGNGSALVAPLDHGREARGASQIERGGGAGKKIARLSAADAAHEAVRRARANKVETKEHGDSARRSDVRRIQSLTAAAVAPPRIAAAASATASAAPAAAASATAAAAPAASATAAAAPAAAASATAAAAPAAAASATAAAAPAATASATAAAAPAAAASATAAAAPAATASATAPADSTSTASGTCRRAGGARRGVVSVTACVGSWRLTDTPVAGATLGRIAAAIAGIGRCGGPGLRSTSRSGNPLFADRLHPSRPRRSIVQRRSTRQRAVGRVVGHVRKAARNGGHGSVEDQDNQAASQRPGDGGLAAHSIWLFLAFGFVPWVHCRALALASGPRVWRRRRATTIGSRLRRRESNVRASPACARNSLWTRGEFPHPWWRCGGCVQRLRARRHADQSLAAWVSTCGVHAGSFSLLQWLWPMDHTLQVQRCD
jgi:hypothetical protein